MAKLKLLLDSVSTVSNDSPSSYGLFKQTVDLRDPDGQIKASITPEIFAPRLPEQGVRV